jgi:hypothetical protein
VSQPKAIPGTDAKLPLDIPSDEGTTVQPPPIALAPDILTLVARELAGSGVAGETRLIKLLYLVVTSRLLPRPCSVAVKGPSSGGKSYLVQRILELFPGEAYYALSAMSDRALAYDQEPLAHRMLVIYEATGMSGDMASYLVRSLLSEGRVDYVTVEKTKAGLTSKRIQREGPTGLITTTTAVHLHPENETRLVSLTVCDTQDQTRAVMLAYATDRPKQNDHAEWHAVQAWLARSATEVTIPFAAGLARSIPPVAIRLRRDFPTLLTLVAAHALLHQASRPTDTDGRIVATLVDYAAVRDLLADLLAEGAERSVPSTVRATVEAVRRINAERLLEEGVTVVALAVALELDKSSALRRARVAIERGYLKNLEERRGRPARLMPGEALPADASVLPSVEEIARLHGCAPDAGVTEMPIELDYPASAWALEGEWPYVMGTA